MRNLIVIGTSAGGISAVKKILPSLGNTINASVLMVQHLSRNSDVNAIISIFQRLRRFIVKSQKMVWRSKPDICILHR